MKEMYLKVEVEQNHGNWVDVFYRQGRYFTCSKDDTELVEIEDAENKGAVKFAESLKCIINKIKSHAYGGVEKAFPKCDTLGDILTKFTPREINDRVEGMKRHVPTTGDVYESRHSGSKVVVMRYDMKTESVQFMEDTCFSSITLNTLNKLYSFTGRNYNEFSSILNELKGDNT